MTGTRMKTDELCVVPQVHCSINLKKEVHEKYVGKHFKFVQSKCSVSLRLLIFPIVFR